MDNADQVSADSVFDVIITGPYPDLDLCDVPGVNKSNPSRFAEVKKIIERYKKAFELYHLSFMHACIILFLRKCRSLTGETEQEKDLIIPLWVVEVSGARRPTSGTGNKDSSILFAVVIKNNVWLLFKWIFVT